MAISYIEGYHVITPGDEWPFIKWLVQQRLPNVKTEFIIQSVEEVYSKERIAYERSVGPTHSEIIMVVPKDDRGRIMVVPMVPNLGFDITMRAATDKGYIGMITYNYGQMAFRGMIPTSIFRVCSIIKLDQLYDFSTVTRAFCHAVTISRESLDPQPFTVAIHSSELRAIDICDRTDTSRYTLISSIGNEEIIVASEITRWRAKLLTSILAYRDPTFQRTILPACLMNCKRSEEE